MISPSTGVSARRSPPLRRRSLGNQENLFTPQHMCAFHRLLKQGPSVPASTLKRGRALGPRSERPQFQIPMGTCARLE